MADSTSPPDKTPEGLSEQPLGVLSSLSGLGLRLQRYALLGSQPLRISQPETLLSDRASTVANRLETPQSSADMGLLGKVDVALPRSPEPPNPPA
ncbi:MAG: hypothetical protein HC812_00935 [Leptolyngbya sp. RL_3_1]|nr:hypothetical protein [Leptolyngbya sp. RL_3_1]